MKMRRLTNIDSGVYTASAGNFICLILFAILGFTSTLSHANPQGADVIAGQVSFDDLGKQLNITNSDGAIINWQGFSIGQDELTRFIQESASSAVLNRVTGGSMSEILGRLESNGRVFLINLIF